MLPQKIHFEKDRMEKGQGWTNFKVSVSYDICVKSQTHSLPVDLVFRITAFDAWICLEVFVGSLKSLKWVDFLFGANFLHRKCTSHATHYERLWVGKSASDTWKLIGQLTWLVRVSVDSLMMDGGGGTICHCLIRNRRDQRERRMDVQHGNATECNMKWTTGNYARAAVD